MQKTKKQKTIVDLSSDMAIHLGAWVLTAAALLSSTEMLLHTEHAAAPVPVGSGHSTYMPAAGMTARAESSRETARMPEEYDVGLRMPAISGQ